MIKGELHNFTGTVREALQNLMNSNIDDKQWALASLGIKDGGLGLRDAARHTHAAFIASFLSCKVGGGRRD